MLSAGSPFFLDRPLRIIFHFLMLYSEFYRTFALSLAPTGSRVGDDIMERRLLGALFLTF